MNICPIEEYHYSDESIGVDDVKITYVNSGDCVNDEPQTLEVSAINNGTARFISIKTDRWSISDVDDLIEVLNDFKKRSGLKNGLED